MFSVATKTCFPSIIAKSKSAIHHHSSFKTNICPKKLLKHVKHIVKPSATATQRFLSHAPWPSLCPCPFLLVKAVPAEPMSFGAERDRINNGAINNSSPSHLTTEIPKF